MTGLKPTPTPRARLGRRLLVAPLLAGMACVGVAGVTARQAPLGTSAMAPVAKAVSCAPDDTATDPTSTPTSTPTDPATPAGRDTAASTTSPTATPTTTPTTPPAPASQVQMVQANIKSGEELDHFKADLRKVFKDCPDFVTFNEVPYRQPSYLAPAGYAIYRTPGQYTGATPVVWRTDRWSAIARGTTMISNKQGYGKGQHVMWGVRYANWVTLRSVDGKQTVSVVSVHIAPKSDRTTKLLGPSIKRLGALAGALSAAGPVMVGGDFNRHYKSSEYPRALLDAAELTAVYDISGHYAPTGDHFGATIDYVMVRPAAVFSVQRQKTREMYSDHDALVVDLGLPLTTEGESPISFSPGTMVNDPTSALQRGRATITHQVLTALRRAPQGSQVRVLTSALTMKRIARQLRAADARGVRVQLVSNAATPTDAETWLADKLAGSDLASWVRRRPDDTQTATTLLVSQSGITPWLRLDIDQPLGSPMVSAPTTMRTFTDRTAYKQAVSSFKQWSTQP